jgi:hypothetical protein
MAEEYSFPPYEQEMMKVLNEFGGEKMTTYEGEDITPLWDLKGGGLSWSFKYLYSAPKLEKIMITVQSYRDKLMTYVTNIFPDDQHALPIYNCFWAESAKGSLFILDFYPLADCICDIPYMEKYLEPLEDVYQRGIKQYNELSTRDTDWFRAMTSPYFLTAEVAPSTKESQGRLLGLALDYLKIYYDLWQKDQARDEQYMKRLTERKTAMRKNMRERDPGGLIMEKAVGKKIAELSLRAGF